MVPPRCSVVAKKESLSDDDEAAGIVSTGHFHNIFYVRRASEMDGWAVVGGD